MRIVFLIIVLIHAFIHLLGFIKAFELKEVNEMTLPISKPAGILWLVATVSFLLYGLLFMLNKQYAWMAGLAAVIVSQALVMYFWKDARFGTIANVIVLLVSIVSVGSYLIFTEFTSAVKNDFSVNNQFNAEILTENDMAHLPAIVQKYLHYTRSVGQPKVKNFRAEFIGGMRSKPVDKYMKVQSVQYNFYPANSRYFYMTATKMGLPATGLHQYRNATATFLVKMLNWFSVVDARGTKLDQAETVTVFNDMCFIAPATLIDKRINWLEVDSTTVKAVFSNGNIAVSALLSFKENGELINFISNDRFETDGKTYTSYPWETPVESYRLLNGYFLPGKARLIYKKPEGDFTYGELEFKSVKYNVEKMEN